MTLDTFFKKFDQFADAPDAVAKMRELVLELASKGALSERRASDQTDSAWRKFSSEFDSLGVRLKPDSSLPFEIPKAWRWVTLDELGTTKIRNDVDDDTLVSFVPMTLISAKYGVPAQSEERSWREVKKGFTHFAEGDVVMAKITPCFENAKSAVMRNLVNGVGAGTTELLVFRGETKIILPEFVLIYLKTRGFISRGEPRMTGSAGQKRVPRDYFAGSPFPLPPLAEQKRIVAKVDELMALCDRLEAQQQERDEQASALARASLARFAEAHTPANLNLLFHKSYSISSVELRKSILTMAVHGKLVSHDTNDEPASQQLETIQKKKAALIQKQEIKKGEPSRPIDPDEVDHKIPESWVWVRLVDICELITDGTHQTPKYTETGRIFLSAQNVKPFRFMPEKHRFVSEDDYQGYVKSRKPERGDILLTRVGAGIGEAATINQDLDFAIYVSLGLVRPVRGFVFPDYITLWLNSPDGTEKSNRNTYGKGVSQGNLNLSLIRNFLVPLPPLAEQRRIVAKADQLMILVDQLEAQLAASRSSAAKLLEALVSDLAMIQIANTPPDRSVKTHTVKQ